MATIQNPSTIQISDWDTLQRNFTENSQKVFCASSQAAGALAILGGVTGAAYAAPAAFVGLGALAIVGAAACGGQLDPDEVAGQGPAFSGGQCPVQYVVSYLLVYDPTYSETGSITVSGKIHSVDRQTPPGMSDGIYCDHGIASNPEAHRYTPIFLQFSVYPGATIQNITVVRVDGLPDDCGSLPRAGGQIIINTETGDTIDTTNITNNTFTTFVVPVGILISGNPITVNMPFSNIKVAEAFPLKFSLDIGGVKFHFQNDHSDPQNPILKPVPGPAAPEPTPGSDSDQSQIIKLLKEIKECSCKPDVDLDMLFLPYIDKAQSCSIVTEALMVPKGSVDGPTLQLFQETAQLAVQQCERENIQQQQPTLIYSASTTAQGVELFTPLIGTEVVSLKLVITETRQEAPQLLTLYPAASQRKFGSVSYVLGGVNGGGDYIYIFDTETYIPLPKRGQPGRLRLLLKNGLSFNVYDTGERI